MRIELDVRRADLDCVLLPQTGRYRAGKELRVEGSGTVAGAVITIPSQSASGAVIGTATVAASVAPATTGTWSLRLEPAPATDPGPVHVDSSLGGTAGPYTLQ